PKRRCVVVMCLIRIVYSLIQFLLRIGCHNPLPSRPAHTLLIGPSNCILFLAEIHAQALEAPQSDKAWRQLGHADHGVMAPRSANMYRAPQTRFARGVVCQ